jgi:hypothetical protein
VLADQLQRDRGEERLGVAADLHLVIGPHRSPRVARRQPRGDGLGVLAVVCGRRGPDRTGVDHAVDGDPQG